MSEPAKPPDIPDLPDLPTDETIDWNMEGAASLEAQGSRPSATGSRQKKHNESGTSKTHMEQMNITYTQMDQGPYRLYFELRDTMNGVKRINRFSLGSKLRKLETFKKHIDDMKQVGRNRIMVYINSYIKANSLMEVINNDKNGEYKAFVPIHLVCVTGIVAGIPAEIPIEDIQEDMQCDAPIVSVKRMTRKEGADRVPINRISVMFRARALPDLVRLFCCTSKVRPFHQKLIVCSKCLRFNHYADNCRGSRRCEQCLTPHEKEEEFTNCTKQMRCAHCKSTEHRTNDNVCKEKTRQLNIKKLMAKSAITYTEAQEIFPIWTQNSYAALDNADEFPSLPSTYVEMATGRYTNPLREQWQKTNEERTKILPAVKLYKDKPKEPNKRTTGGNKRPRTDESTPKAETSQAACSKEGPGSKTNGAALNNPHKVTEQEKWDRITQDAKRNAETAASQNIKNTVMSFYAEFLQEIDSSEEVKRKFKECTQKHFNLTSSVVEKQIKNKQF